MLWWTWGLGGRRTGKPICPHQQPHTKHTSSLQFAELCCWPCLSSAHLHTPVISGLCAGVLACSCTKQTCMEMAKLHHSTAYTVGTTLKEKVWFGACHCTSISFENWFSSHIEALDVLTRHWGLLEAEACLPCGLTEGDTKFCCFYFTAASTSFRSAL